MRIPNYYQRPRFRHWTKDATDCYNRHCICAGCFYNEFFKGKCEMKNTVLEMVRHIGTPPDAKDFNGVIEE